VLLGGRLLRTRSHDDAPAEDAARALAEHTLVELAARAVRHGVIDERVVVDVALARSDEEAVELDLGALLREHDLEVVAHERAAERERLDAESCAAFDARVAARDVECGVVLALQHDDVELRVGGDADLGECVREAHARSCTARREVEDDDRSARALGFDPHARELNSGRRFERKRRRLAQHRALRHLQRGDAAEECGIERRERIALHVGERSNATFERGGVDLRGRARSGELERIEVDPAKRARRVLPVFEPRRRQPLLLEARQRVVAHRAQPRGLAVGRRITPAKPRAHARAPSARAFEAPSIQP